MLFAAALIAACSPKGEQTPGEKKSPSSMLAETPKPTGEEIHGKLIEKVELTHPLDQAWVTKGREVYDLKCAACHKLDDQRVVGPGWKGVTTRRQPEWIMNMVTNVDVMLATDETAQQLLEQCLTRMPNQNVTEEEARRVLEFMRSNDGEK